ncbi:hypothetical protein ACLMJK_007687 [Lecanora helva]
MPALSTKAQKADRRKKPYELKRKQEEKRKAGEDIRAKITKRKQDLASATEATDREKYTKEISQLEVELSDHAKDLMDIDNEVEQMETQEKDAETDEDTEMADSDGGVDQTVKEEGPEEVSGESAGLLQVPQNGRTRNDPVVLDGEEPILIQVSDSRPIAEDKHRKVLAVKNFHGGRVGIVQYGPRNSPVHRREDVTGMDLKDPYDDLSDPMKRFGEAKHWDKQGKLIWKAKRHEFCSVAGVAFPSSYNVEDLHHKIKRDVRFPVDVLMVWNIKGERKKTWETFSTFKRLWGKQKWSAAKAIYRAATTAEERFEEWRSGARLSEDRSPTPDPKLAAARDKDKSEKGRSSQKSRKKKAISRTKASARDDSSDSDSDNESDEDSSDTSDNEVLVVSDSESEASKPKAKGRKTRKKKTAKRDESEDESDDEIEVMDLKRLWCRKKKKNIKKLSQKDEKNFLKWFISM